MLAGNKSFSGTINIHLCQVNSIANLKNETLSVSGGGCNIQVTGEPSLALILVGSSRGRGGDRLSLRTGKHRVPV